MADFKKAFAITMGNEGGYSFDAQDPGGETYKGISRVYNPHWGGWAYIDQVKQQNPGATHLQLSKLLAANADLQANIQDFYKAGYWDTFKGDLVKDQQLANNMFDCSVNQGDISRFIMQDACNAVMEQVGSPMPRLAVDGAIGTRTVSTFNSLSYPKLNVAINQLRTEHWEKDSDWPIYKNVWLARLKNYV
jgi:lysozyme family protein